MNSLLSFYLSEPNDMGMRTLLIARGDSNEIMSEYFDLIFLPKDVLVPGRQEGIVYTRVYGEMIAYAPRITYDPLETWIRVLDPRELLQFLDPNAPVDSLNKVLAITINYAISNIKTSNQNF